MENDNKVRNIDTESLKKMKINFKIVNIKPKIRELEKIVPEKEVIRCQYYDSIYLQKFWILETQIKDLMKASKNVNNVATNSSEHNELICSSCNSLMTETSE